MQKVRTFGSSAQPYACECCGRITRPVDESAEFRLCSPCYELALLENQHSDEGHEGDIHTCAVCGPDVAEQLRKGGRL